ncbi:hypothetical protein DJ71_16355, partial [Halorubrum sp. E3]
GAVVVRAAGLLGDAVDGGLGAVGRRLDREVGGLRVGGDDGDRVVLAGADRVAQGGDLLVAAVGGDVDRFAEDLNREGVDAVHAVANGEEFDHNVYQSAVGAETESTHGFHEDWDDLQAELGI